MPGRMPRPSSRTIPTPSVGAATLRYTYETPFGSVYPNTPVELGFRITFDDGRTVDGPTTTLLYQDDRFTWKTLKGSIVRVHWYDGSTSFGQRALDIGERAIENASALLGVTETEPVDFYIYADRDKFYDVIGPSLPENVGGLALSDIRTLFANIAPSDVDDPWVGIVVPPRAHAPGVQHGDEERLPRAAALAERGPRRLPRAGLRRQRTGAASRAARTGDLMPLRALVGQFPSPPAKFSLAYDESVSAIDYMVGRTGRRRSSA